MTGKALTAGLKSAALVCLTRGRGTRRLASETAHSVGGGRRELSGGCDMLLTVHNPKLENNMDLQSCFQPNALPLSSIRRSTGSPTPNAAACGGVAGLWSGQQCTRVRGNS